MGRGVAADLTSRKLTLIGYGNQARGQAMNLRDAGCAPVIALRPGSNSHATARDDGFETADIATACAAADIVAFLVPDEVQGDLWSESVREAVRPGAALVFAHGFSVHFGMVTPPEDLDVLLVAPKGAGSGMRYREACSWAVHQDASGQGEAIATAYARAIVGDQARLFETSFREEAVSDLFGEQVSLCGGVPSLILTAYEALVEAGVSPDMAYYDVVQEIKLIADLIASKGLAGMYETVSDTAEYGAYETGPKLVGPETRAAMAEIMQAVTSGAFAERWVAEARNGRPSVAERRKQARAHGIEAAGRRARGET